MWGNPRSTRSGTLPKALRIPLSREEDEGDQQPDGSINLIGDGMKIRNENGSVLVRILNVFRSKVTAQILKDP